MERLIGHQDLDDDIRRLKERNGQAMKQEALGKRDWKREEFAHAMVNVGGCAPWKMVDYERSRTSEEYGTRWRIVVPNVVELKMAT